MSRKIKRIRTGGQSGVDRAALDVARELNIEICGWCPSGGWAEDYTTPPGLLSDYPELTETPSEGTTQRTLWNMRDADAILTIIPGDSGKSEGTEVGVREGEHLQKPMFTARGVEDAEEISAWMWSLALGGEFETGAADVMSGSDAVFGIELCVGGPRASECPEGYQVTMEILEKVLKTMRLEQ